MISFFKGVHQGCTVFSGWTVSLRPTTRLHASHLLIDFKKFCSSLIAPWICRLQTKAYITQPALSRHLQLFSYSDLHPGPPLPLWQWNFGGFSILKLHSRWFLLRLRAVSPHYFIHQSSQRLKTRCVYVRTYVCVCGGGVTGNEKSDLDERKNALKQLFHQREAARCSSGPFFRSGFLFLF